MLTGVNVRLFGTLAAMGVLGGMGVAAAPSVGATAGIAAKAPPKPTAADRATTHAYLLAMNSFEEAELANLPQSNAAMQSTAARISGECPGVLTGAPPHEHERGSIVSESPGQPQTSPRAAGERSRETTQLEDLKLELPLAEGSAAQAVNREAAITLLSALTPLRWSDPRINLSLHLTVTFLQEELDLPAIAVCADMNSWVASGYKTLSPASKELAKRTEALLKDAFLAIALHLGEGDHIEAFPKSLAPYENAADRALARHTAALTVQLNREHDAEEKEVVKRLEATVGLPVEKTRIVKRPIRKPAVIDRGKTAAGGRFVVRAERARGIGGRIPRAVRQPVCTVDITIEEPSRPYGGGGLLGFFTGGGTDRCLSRSHVTPEPSVQCNAGLLTIEADLLPAARSARLLLSDGRTITSPAIIVPKRLGGPAGLYYQVVRGPSPIPVSLTELDARGNQLTVLKLPAVVECAKHLKKYFPHGIVRLVHETPPQGPTFTISAERYRELGRVHFDLTLEEEGGEQALFSSHAGGHIEEKLEEGDEKAFFVGIAGKEEIEPSTKKFQSHASSGCKPQPYAIVYGLLRARRDTVLVGTAGGLVPLRKVVIPAHLHAGGVLAYGVFSPLPTELVVRDKHGRTITRSDLRQAAQADTETCEGEAEG